MCNKRPCTSSPIKGEAWSGHRGPLLLCPPGKCAVDIHQHALLLLDQAAYLVQLVLQVHHLPLAVVRALRYALLRSPTVNTPITQQYA